MELIQALQPITRFQSKPGSQFSHLVTMICSCSIHLHPLSSPPNSLDACSPRRSPRVGFVRATARTWDFHPPRPQFATRRRVAVRPATPRRDVEVSSSLEAVGGRHSDGTNCNAKTRRTPFGHVVVKWSAKEVHALTLGEVLIVQT